MKNNPHVRPPFPWKATADAEATKSTPKTENRGGARVNPGYSSHAQYDVPENWKRLGVADLSATNLGKWRQDRSLGRNQRWVLRTKKAFGKKPAAQIKTCDARFVGPPGARHNKDFDGTFLSESEAWAFADGFLRRLNGDREPSKRVAVESFDTPEKAARAPLPGLDMFRRSRRRPPLDLL